MEKMNIYEYADYDQRSQKLFSTLPREKLGQLVLRRFKKGDFLIRIGTKPDLAYIILEGVCSMLRVNDETDCPQIGPQLGYLDAVGLAELVKDIPRIGSVNAFTDGVAALLDRDLFRAWTDEYPRFILSLYSNVVERLFQDSDYNNLCTKYSVYCGVISFLLYKRALLIKRTPEFTGPVKIDFTREVIATAIGSDVRSVSRAISQLRHEGLVTVEKKKILVNGQQQAKMDEVQKTIISDL